MTDHPQRLVILGASGDLTKRLLLPGLGTLLANDTGRQVEVWGGRPRVAGTNRMGRQSRQRAGPGRLRR